MTDVVVLEGQFTEMARQVERHGDELVVGQVQGFQGPERKQTEEEVQIKSLLSDVFSNSSCNLSLLDGS